ncbi:MAG TPA: glycosyl hydrolase [Streptosporangiaceae bacterium]
MLRSRARRAVAAAAVLAAAAAAGARLSGGPGQTMLPTRPASYLGVYEKGPPDRYQPVTGFAQVTGRQPNLAGYYGGWGEPFKTSFARTAWQHGAATLLQWDPGSISLAAIAAGRHDRYLRSFAASVRGSGHPVVIGFGHEMNAYWYAWGYRHTPPAVFVAAWRHIVTLFRHQGADNVTWLWTLQADEKGTGPVAAWWPGAAYVTWVGIDGYYYRPGDTFFSVFGATIAEVRVVTGKPILVSEASAGQVAGQAAKIGDLFAGMRRYGTLGLVWFDIAQDDGLYHQDWHLEGHPAAVAAFRRAAQRLSLARP